MGDSELPGDQVGRNGRQRRRGHVSADAGDAEGRLEHKASPPPLQQDGPEMALRGQRASHLQPPAGS